MRICYLISGQCGSNGTLSDTTLTSEDVDNVQKTWKQVYGEWKDKHGIVFFCRLFKNHKGVKGFFQHFNNLSDDELMKSAELQAHVIVFGTSMDSFIKHLTDTETLVHLIQKMTDNHTARGITLQYFKSATKELLSYIVDTLKPTKAQKSSWLKVIAAVDTIVQDRVNQTK